jgi:hypothetical protein
MKPKRYIFTHKFLQRAFESSVFWLLHLGMAWLHPQLKWLSATFEEIPNKEQAIWNRLNQLRSHKATDKALKEVFGVPGEVMFRNVLGPEDARRYLGEYQKLAEHRNYIVHQGRRYLVTDEKGKTTRWAAPQSQQLLDACLKWIPGCWTVFSRLHNEYIHKPMWQKQA